MDGDDHFFLPRGMADNQYAGTFLVVCALEDGDAIAFNKGALRSTYPVYFLDHERYPDYDLGSNDVVAASFTDFLERLLDCGGKEWW
jgi:hypothetical protein